MFLSWETPRSLIVDSDVGFFVDSFGEVKS